MELYVKKYSKYSILVSLALILLSILLIAKPTEFLNAIMIIFGIIVGISGIIQIIQYFCSPKEFKAFSFKLIIGIIMIIFSIIVIVNSKTINILITSIIGVWMIVQSIIKLQIALNLREIANNNWKAICILSIITLLLGVLIIINPFTTLATVGRISGIMLLISEIVNLFESIFMLRI